jgi:hypothetical protein
LKNLPSPLFTKEGNFPPFGKGLRLVEEDRRDFIINVFILIIVLVIQKIIDDRMELYFRGFSPMQSGYLGGPEIFRDRE